MEPDFPPCPLGLYVHIPWCISRCAYCVFFAHKYSRSGLQSYLELLSQEKNLYLPYIDRPLNSVYFGGGTPSLLSAGQIKSILHGLVLAKDAEITLEINPLQVNASYVKELATTAVNRLSLGIQSLNDGELQWLTRSHKAAEIAPKIQLLQDAGFENISADLIYGLPHSSLAALEANLQNYWQLPLSHLSCYLLELHEGGALASFIPDLPDDEALALQYELICKRASEAGFVQYEISNFARAGAVSRHNLLYWRSADYLALGASASGHYNGVKYKNPASLEGYAQSVKSAMLWPDADGGEYAQQDYIMMALRLREGLHFQDYERRFGEPFGRRADIAKLSKLGMLEASEAGIRLSVAALFISNSVIAELL